jgi:thioesterase domain-containing protein
MSGSIGLSGSPEWWIEALTPIWQRVLQRSPISPDDDFFDLGGSPPLARQLFSEIAQATGRELPFVSICYTPTIATLAERLAQPEPKPLPPLVLLNKVSTGVPIFLAQGIGSSAVDFVELARELSAKNPVYCLQTRGVDGLQDPLNSIEDMAEWFLAAIRQIQPNGPYFLIGYSLGGVIMMEIAQRLRKQGKTIASLTMIDAYLHKDHLSIGQRFRLTLRMAMRSAGIRLRSRSSRNQNELMDSASDSPLIQTATRVDAGCNSAWMHYQPSFYPAKIRFVRAQIRTFFPANPSAVWARWADEFEVETVLGNHVEMITHHCAELAKVLSDHLRKASM